MPPLDALHAMLPSDVALAAAVAPLDRTHEACLSAEERARCAAFGHPTRRVEFTLGRAAARRLLAERLRVPPAEVPLVVAPDDALDVAGAPLHVSITHKHERAVAGVANRPLGIDLEAVRPHHPRLYRRVFRDDERAHIDALDLDLAHATMLGWAIKESVLKLLRTGFRLSPQRLRMQIDLARRSAEVEVEEGRVWPVRFAAWDAFYLAVAYDGEPA